IIAVIMGASTPKERNRQVTEMLDYAYSQYELQKRYGRGEFFGETRVSKGATPTVAISVDENVSLLTKKGESLDGVTERLEMKDSVAAPIKKGDELGKLYIEKDGEVISETKVVAEVDVSSASLWTLMKRTTSLLVGNKAL